MNMQQNDPIEHKYIILRITMIYYYGPGACVYSAQHATTGARTQ